MGKAAFKKSGDKVGGWCLVKVIGQGGNGTVWHVSKKGQPDAAMKILRNMSPKSFTRLSAEISALQMAKDIEGVLPVIDVHVPFNEQHSPHWFVMPIAQDCQKAVFGNYVVEVVRLFTELAITLSALHDRGIYHRDIKLSNILFMKSRLYLADFGLVKYPSRQEITAEKEDIGPRFTMAPEMRRNASEANGEKADVFSFAKALWVALTKEHQGFDGQYNPSGILGLSRYHEDTFMVTLDEIMIACTDNDPFRRPPMKDVVRKLIDWIHLQTDYDDVNLLEWSAAQQYIFPFGIPSTAEWNDVDVISSILQAISRNGSVNHMFFPNGGGHAIERVSRSWEPGFIRLHTGVPIILKPERLIFNSFGMSARWNYFTIECEGICPTNTKGSYISQDGYYEGVYELGETYVSDDDVESGMYQNIPEGSGPISRYLKGSFVIFCTRSPYNLNSATYDARHERMGGVRFREYIRKSAEIDKSRILTDRQS